MKKLLFFILLIGCTPTMRTFTATDGETYYAYECSNFETCMRGVRDQCSENYHVLHTSQVQTSGYPSAMPLAEAGAEELAHGSGRIVFTCVRNETDKQIAALRHDMIEIAEKIDDRPLRFNDGF